MKLPKISLPKIPIPRVGAIQQLSKTGAFAFNTASKAYFQNRRFKNLQHPELDQQKFLWDHIQRCQNTAIGKKYHFGQVNSLKERRQNMPIMNHESHRIYIELCMMGFGNILIPGKVPLFAKTAGTTSSYTKFVPVTYRALDTNHFRGGKDLLSRYIYNNPDSKIFEGKSIVVGGNFDENPYMPGNMNCGYISAILQQKSPYIGQMMREPNGGVEFIDSWEDKLDYIINSCRDKNITSMGGLVSWSIMILEKMIEENGSQNIYDIWPNFELYISGGMKFEPYRRRFEQLFPGGRTKFYQSYNASEGFIAVQNDNDDNSMLLLTNHGIYYEFVELDRWFELGLDKSENISDIDIYNRDILPLSQIETNKNYVLLITTVAGLRRYPIGDTIKFVSKNPYKIELTGRIKYRMDIFDERLTEDEVQSALDKTCEELDCIIDNWTLGSKWIGESSGKHIYIIEFIKYPEDIAKFTKVLDQSLQQINGDYEYVRQGDKFLLLPEIVAVTNGTFYKWLQKNGKLGGQNKIPKIYNGDKIINDFL